MTKLGTLYLIPSPLGESDISHIFPSFNTEIIQEIDHFIVEDLRTGRRFIKKLGMLKPMESLDFQTLNEHSKIEEVEKLMMPCLDGKNVGLVSDAGTPCVADPGAALAAYAQEKKIPIVPLIGPNSILLGLMASGLNGQSFAFNGYLPRDQKGREYQLRFLESLLKKNKQTQIFIETPYRNNHVFKSIIATCENETKLCLATNVATPFATVRTMTIKKWRSQKVDIHKLPTVFLLGL